MITQRLHFSGHGRWTCPGCQSSVTGDVLQHPDDCPELRRGNTLGPLPSVAQVHGWLHAYGWVPQPPGPAGRLWHPEGRPEDAVAVLHDGEGVELPGALERIAKRSGVPFGEMLAGMRAIAVKKTSSA